MMGDRTKTDQTRVSAIYGTLFIITLSLVGVALVAGATAAVDAQTGSADSLDAHAEATPEPIATHLEPIDTMAVESQVATEQAESTTQSASFAADVDADEVIEVTDREVEIEILTSQFGEVEAPRAPKDVILVPEQTFAMHTFWGTHYPSSNTVSYIEAEQEVLTVDTGQVLNDKSFTAIGDWFGIGSVISGPFPYQCKFDEGGWFSSDEHWCGWKDTSSWYQGSEPADAEMYHVDSEKSLSFVNGFDYDLDNWRYDMHLRAGGLHGQWVELETEWGQPYGEVDDHETDEIYDNPDFAEFEDLDIPLDDLYYIDYTFGSDTWGIDTGQGDAWLRMSYDGFLTEVDNAAPLDPFGERFYAMEAVLSVLNGASGDQMGLVVDGEVQNPLEDSFLEIDEDLDDLDNIDKILQEHELFNSSEAEELLEEIEEEIDDFEFDPEEYAGFNMWDIDNADGGLENAVHEMPDHEFRDSHIVLVTGGQEPLRPQDEWYEIIGDSFLDAMPDWSWIPDGFLDDRLTPEEAGPITDDHVIEWAELAGDKGASVHTLGLGEAHDGFRLAAIADAADDSSNCLDDPNSPTCNYEAVTDPSGIADAMLQQLFDGTSENYDVTRNPATLSVIVNGEETHDLGLGNINDPQEFFVEQPLGNPVETTFEDVTFLDELQFQVEIQDCNEFSHGGISESFPVTDNFDVVYDYLECTDPQDSVLAAQSDNYVFTHGDDVDALSDTRVVEWPEDPADYLAANHPELIAADGTLDLEDDDDERDGAIVIVPVDANPQGYVMAHVEYDQLPDSTYFEIQSTDVENADHVAYETADGEETIVHASGKDLAVDFEVFNGAQTGEETITLETEDGQVLASMRRGLSNDQTSAETFEWSPGEGDIGYHGPLVVSSQNHELETDVMVEILPPGTDMDIGPAYPRDRIYVDLTGDDMEATEIPRDDPPIEFNATIFNRGPDPGEDEWVSLDVAEGVSLSTAETIDDIGAWGWNGTDPAGEPADNVTVEFAEEWDPGFEIVSSWDDDGVGVSGIEVEIQTDDDTTHWVLEVVYQVDPETVESELDDLDDEGFDPIDIDIDEIELES